MMRNGTHRSVSSRHLRVRVQSCVDTILQLNSRLGEGKIRADVIERFQQLKQLLERVSEDSVEEWYVSQIEEATNQLLAEIRLSLGDKAGDCSCEGQRH